MPQMSGKDLTEKMRALRPDIKVVFMSGHDDNMVAQHGVIRKDVRFIQKPFSPETFVSTIKKTLKK